MTTVEVCVFVKMFHSFENVTFSVGLVDQHFQPAPKFIEMTVVFAGFFNLSGMPVAGGCLRLDIPVLIPKMFRNFSCWKSTTASNKSYKTRLKIKLRPESCQHQLREQELKTLYNKKCSTFSHHFRVNKKLCAAVTGRTLNSFYEKRKCR